MAQAGAKPAYAGLQLKSAASQRIVDDLNSEARDAKTLKGTASGQAKLHARSKAKGEVETEGTAAWQKFQKPREQTPSAVRQQLSEGPSLNSRRADFSGDSHGATAGYKAVRQGRMQGGMPTAAPRDGRPGGWSTWEERPANAVKSRFA